MNKEEKEAIDDLKLAIEQDKEELPYSKESLKNKQAILNYINKLQKENEKLKRVKEQSQEILSSIKIAYMVHTKDCELLLKDIKKWEKMLDK